MNFLRSSPRITLLLILGFGGFGGFGGLVSCGASQETGTSSPSLVCKVGASGTLNLEEATSCVEKQVIAGHASKQALVALKAPRRLESGEVVSPFFPDKINETPAKTTILNPTWLFFLDTVPNALFSHPTEFVYVDATTGTITVEKQKWWPAVDGKTFINPNYADKKALSNNPPFAGPKSIQFPKETHQGSEYHSECGCVGRRGVVIQGGEDTYMPGSALKVRDHLGNPKGYTAAERRYFANPTTTDLDAYFKSLKKLSEEDPFCELFVYIIAHGSDSGGLALGGADANQGFVGLYANQYALESLPRWVADIRAKRTKVVIESCYSGLFLEDKHGTPDGFAALQDSCLNLEAITSTDKESWAIASNLILDGASIIFTGDSVDAVFTDKFVGCWKGESMEMKGAYDCARDATIGLAYFQNPQYFRRTRSAACTLYSHCGE